MDRETRYYSSGTFAKLAGVTLRTVRYYDKVNILKPSYVKESGSRFYTDEDLARLQQVLFLKYLGLSLDDIREMTVADSDQKYLLQTLEVQKKLVRDRIWKMQQVEQAIDNMTDSLKTRESVDWAQMLHLIHLTGNETQFKIQYLDSSNLSSRIHLHELYSMNKQGWYPWVFQQLNICTGMRVLELGCGDGSLWKINMNSLNLIPGDLKIVLTDSSEGMINETRHELGIHGGRFSYRRMECERIDYPDNSFDLVIANHVLFYCCELEAALHEIRRVLKPGGKLVTSTYSINHMKEINQLVEGFDTRIRLSDDKLYEKFGKDNGEQLMTGTFENISWVNYEDELLVTEVEPLVAYILSCHGNQGKYISERYGEFRKYAKARTDKGFHITKDVGLFICR